MALRGLRPALRAAKVPGRRYSAPAALAEVPRSFGRAAVLAGVAGGFALGAACFTKAEPRPKDVETLTIMMPSDANPGGNVFGGRILELMEQGGWLAAVRWSGASKLVSASIDEMDFLGPMFIGEICKVSARVNSVKERSMEVEVTVTAENPTTGTSRVTNHAFLTYVRTDRAALPQYTPSSDAEATRAAEASVRYEQRKTGRSKGTMTADPWTREDAVEMLKVAMPEDAYKEGLVGGGVVMKLVDLTAGLAAAKHAKGPVVTASLDRMDFCTPIYVGDVIKVQARVSFTSSRSMEIDVKVFAESLGEVPRFTSSSRLVFVHLGPDHRPAPIPMLTCETDEEKARFAEGEERYIERKKKRIQAAKAAR